MKKLTLPERIQRYVAKHPNVDPRLKVYMKTSDGQYLHVVSGKAAPKEPRWWYAAFDRYYTRQNGLHTCAYMNVDTKLGIYEMSIVNVCTKSFKTFPAPRHPVWVSRRFFEIGQSTPYDEQGVPAPMFNVYRTDMNTDWRGSSWLGRGVTFLTMFARRVGMANNNIKLTDCLGTEFYDGHWTRYAYNEYYTLDSGDSGHVYSYDDYRWFYRFFTTGRPSKAKPTPKQYKTPPLTSRLTTTIAQQLNEGKLLLSPLSNNVFFGKVYEKYNVLYKREEHVGANGLSHKWSQVSVWNPNSTRCRVYGNRNYALPPEIIEKLPKGPEFLACRNLKNKSFGVDVGQYFNFWNPIYESLVKICSDERIWRYSLEDLFGPTYTRPKLLHQKLGVSKQQLSLWLSYCRAHPDSDIAFIKTVKVDMFAANIASMSIVATMDRYLSARYILAMRYFKAFFNIQEGTHRQDVLIRWLFDQRNRTVISFIGDVCRMGVALRDAQELTGRLNISVNKMITMTPQELEQWHDDISREHQRMQNRIRAAKDTELWGICQKIDKTRRKKWEYEEDDYLIRLPNSLGEIREEGAIQNICIGSYTEMHARGGTNLLFVRKKDNPDQPFLAIEVRDKRICQIHGKRNAWAAFVDPNVVPMLYRWVEKNRFQCEDRILLLQAQGYCGNGIMMPKPEY